MYTFEAVCPIVDAGEGEKYSKYTSFPVFAESATL